MVSTQLLVGVNWLYYRFHRKNIIHNYIYCRNINYTIIIIIIYNSKKNCFQMKMYSIRISFINVNTFVRCIKILFFYSNKYVVIVKTFILLQLYILHIYINFPRGRILGIYIENKTFRGQKKIRISALYII